MSPFFNSLAQISRQSGTELADVIYLTQSFQGIQIQDFQKSFEFPHYKSVEQAGDTLAEYDFSDLDMLE